MQSIYIISITTENTLRVLQRIATILSRHRLNIEQLNVHETINKGVSHFNIVVHSDDALIKKVVKQLQRIVELLDINITNQIPINP